MIPDNLNFRPDKRELGMKSKEGGDATYTWFSPAGEPEHRLRYAVIKEEDGLLQVLPDEGRFKKGLPAWRFDSEEGGSHTVWVVTKVRPNRVDLAPAR